ncbi:MAG: site-specific integrase, partial [Oliverpabstia sp.]|nr:site-specific integrase [Oliverpabstia sp.]
EEVCLQYIEIKNQIRLPSLLTVTSNDSLNRRIRALVILLRYQKTGSLDLSTRGKKVPFSCPMALASAYEAFSAETEKSHLAADTKSTIIKSTQRFILSVSEDGLADWGLLDMSYIDLFLSKYKDNQLKYRGTLIYGLKKFLHFLFDNGFCEIDYTEDILSLRIPRNGHVPHTWTPDELKRLLEAVDRQSPSGKRDYAIFSLCIQTGLRAADIRNLKINDINWKTHTLKIITGKTGEPLELPLLEAVGWAIIDYLKNGRPESGYTNVFLAHHFPYGPIGSTSSLTGALRKYLIKAEIEIKAGEAHGIHTLRSTLAQNMLFCGTELPVISQTLAHRDERTTVGNYLRIDTEHLRDCSLELEWEDEADAEL